MAKETQKDAAIAAMIAKQKGKPTGDPRETELTADFKKAHPDKSDDEIRTLVQTRITEDAANSEKLTAKTAEIKARPENKDKTDEDIKAILKSELENPPKPDNLKVLNDLLKEHTKGAFTDINTILNQKPKTVNELIKEHTKGTFADIDTLLNKANETKADFANDQIRHLNEIAKNGTDILEVLKYQSLGIDKLDPSNLDQAKELIKHELRLSKPGITEKELDYELKYSYPTELKKETYEDENGEKKERTTNTEEVEISKLKLMRTAREAKEKLQKKQKDMELPKTNGFSKEQAQQLKDQWNAKVEESLKDTNDVTFTIGDKTFKYVIKDKEKLKTTMKEADSFLKRYVNNGQTDMKRYQQDMLASNEMENIVKSAYEQGESVGYENAINSISNLSVETGNGRPPSGEPKTPAQHLAKKFRAEIGGY